MLGIFRKKEEVSYLETNIKEKKPIINIDEHSELRAQLDMIELDLEDLAIAQILQPIVIAKIDEVVEDFYGLIGKQSNLIEKIETHSTLANLKDKLSSHIIEMFSGVIDEKFIQKRIVIANMHVKIGLTQKWYIASFNTIFNRLTRFIAKELNSTEDLV